MVAWLILCGGILPGSLSIACPLYEPCAPKPRRILRGSSSPNTLMIHQDIQNLHLAFDFTPDTREMSTQCKIQTPFDHAPLHSMWFQLFPSSQTQFVNSISPKSVKYVLCSEYPWKWTHFRLSLWQIWSWDVDPGSAVFYQYWGFPRVPNDICRRVGCLNASQGLVKAHFGWIWLKLSLYKIRSNSEKILWAGLIEIPQSTWSALRN